MAVITLASVLARARDQTEAPSPSPELRPDRTHGGVQEEARDESKRRSAALILAEHVDVYGRLAGHFTFGASPHFANNATRFGIAAEAGAAGSVGVFGRLEFGAKLGRGDEIFNLDASGPTTFGSARLATSPAIVTRLGFVGVDLGPYGRLSVGKQWGVHFDVAQRTYLFDVFGARGSSTFTGGTDGGWTGTGRASNSLIYRNSLLGFEVGIQAQMLTDRLGLDAAAVSLRYTAPFGLSVAGAYTHSFFGTVVREQLGFPRPIGASRVTILGLGYRTHEFTIDMVYARSWNHEVAFAAGGTPLGVFDADGVEVVASWIYRSRRRGSGSRNRLRLIAGYNGRYPRGVPAQYDYSLHDAMLGLRVFVFDFAWFYVEGRVGLGRETDGRRTPSAVCVGLRYEFSSRRGLELQFANEGIP